MKIGVLTSSRADYGIYKPLLQALKKDAFFRLEIIAFGTHLSKAHGFTINEIYDDGYKTIHKINSLLRDDDEASISESYGITVTKFSSFWKTQKFDIVFCLGDRFEMSAAVQASIPFNIKLAHIHGGETTLGAIDNIYRHQITLASKVHFTSNEIYKNRVVELLQNHEYVYNIGALSLNDIQNFKLASKQQLLHTFGIDDKPFILCTFHPETLAISKTSSHANEMKNALSEICKTINIVITMPNADTFGSIFRKALNTLKEANKTSIFLIENFGKTYYFTAMKHSEMLLGNTSSGIIEAASFHKFVVNVGDRQKGRIQSSNVLNTIFKSEDIINKTNKALSEREFQGDNVYYQSNSVKTIVNTLKSLND